MKLRTIDQLYEGVKRIDPDTALTKTAIRRLVISGQLTSIKAGKKYLVSLEALEAYVAASVT